MEMNVGVLTPNWQLVDRNSAGFRVQDGPLQTVVYYDKASDLKEALKLYRKGAKVVGNSEVAKVLRKKEPDHGVDGLRCGRPNPSWGQRVLFRTVRGPLQQERLRVQHDIASRRGLQGPTLTAYPSDDV